MPRVSRSSIPAGIRRALHLPSSKARLARDLDDEVRFHLDARAADLVTRGLSEDAARAEALRRFGDTDDLRDFCQSIEVPHMRRLHFREWLDGWLQDARFAARQFRRAPGFVGVAVITLGLGIGAATAIFSVVNGVLLRSLPYPDADRIVQLWEVDAKGNRMRFADPNFEDVAAQSRSFAALAEESAGGQVPLVVAGEPVRARAAEVSRDFFRIMRVDAARGRLLSPEEQRTGGPRVAVISYGFWQRTFGGAASAIGAPIKLGELALTIVGVMPATLDFPAGTDVWSSREALEQRLPSRTAHNWQVIGRLADGVTLEQARSDLTAIAKRLKEQYGDYTRMSDVAVVPIREQMVGNMREPLLILLGASLVLLLIACANVVNLLVARMAARQGEVAVRLALGAARYRLAQQCFAESLMLSAGGAALGVILARLGVTLLVMLQPANLPRVQDVKVDWIVLLFAIGLSVLAALALGLITAWRGTRGDLREALSQSQRTQSGAGASAGIRRTLVAAQLAMTLVLLVSAAVLGRSFFRVLHVDPGFRAGKAVVLDVWVVDVNDAARRQRVQFYDALLERVRSIPGVDKVGAVNVVPLGGETAGDGTFLIMSSANERIAVADFEKLLQDPARTGQAEYRIASGDYFETMHVPLIRGRVFNDRDTPDAPHVAVISASLAKARWRNANPIGTIIQFGNMDGDLRPFTIIGVVGDVREASLVAPPRPTFYASYRQRPMSARQLNIVMTTTGDPAPIIASARRIVRELRADVPPRFRTMDTIIAGSVADRRFILFLVGVFGGAALVLAALGVYGVISYLVTQREREIGIRVAVGARSPDIVRLVLRQGAALAVTGIIIGAAASLAVTRLIAGLLYGISPADPIAFIVVIVVLGAVSIVASWVPARRASLVDAMEVLRGG